IQNLDIRGRMHLSNGVIQRGGSTAITATSDLGLYSLVTNNYLRFVTDNGPIRFFADGNGDANHIGVKALMDIEPNGNIGIGTTTMPDNSFKLYVKGGIKAEKMKVELCNTGNWCDYVFDKDYKTMSLSELEQFVTKNKHLPEIPSAKEVTENGIDVAEMD